MNKNFKSYILTVLGLILLGMGLFLIKTIPDPQGILKALPYVPDLHQAYEEARSQGSPY